jgi:DNA-binding CsgD family transcriptional regulator/tetratricopeptide (TPR) repeat protein
VIRVQIAAEASWIIARRPWTRRRCSIGKMAAGNAGARGREAYQRRAWADAFAAFTEASAHGPLEAEDVERLAWSALLCRQDAAAIEGFERLHQLRLEAGEGLPAARAAHWVAMLSVTRGEPGRASGWFARVQRLVEAHGRECAEAGFIKVAQAFRAAATGDHESARAAAHEAAAIGDRTEEPNLSALARCMEGRALIRRGRLDEGLPLLDEAMVIVTGRELLPFIAGLVYCGVIAGCQQGYALDRAREWTEALGLWCDTQPQLAPFAGACLIHRSEILQLGGEWPEAFAEAQEASTRLAPTKDLEAGNAFYQEGELHRVRGELAEAERCYVLASERGRDPQPGLALLRLAQGNVEAALAAACRVLLATPDPLQRTRVLPAYVEIALAADDLAGARRACEELTELAGRFGMELLDAEAHHAHGACALASGDARAAIDPLRRAQEIWQRAGAPYWCARVRLLIARVYLALGDRDGAALELDGARKVFTQLGAPADLAAVDALAVAPPPPASAASAPDVHGLSPRELQVLRLVACGKTNKVIGKELFVSEKTVDRHVSNIFAKLDVATRAAATAWAFRHGLAG